MYQNIIYFAQDQLHFKQFFFFLSSLYLTINTIQAQSPLLEDSVTRTTIHQASFHMYSMESDEALRLIETLKPKYEQHPVYPFFKGVALSWAIRGQEKDEAVLSEIIELFEATALLSEQMLSNNPNDVEAIFFALGAHSNLSQFYADNQQTMKAVKEAKKAYNYMKIGFDLTAQFPEFYFSTGLYNYYREKYPEIYPIYKPFAWFFSEGNAAKGLTQLEAATKKSIFSQTEANMYLAHIWLRYEDKPLNALPFIDKLIRQYPENHFYYTLYLEAHLSAKNPGRSLELIEKLHQQESQYYQIAALVYEGLYLERIKGSNAAALEKYLAAIQKVDKEELNANHLLSLAHLGAGRIYLENNDKTAAHAQLKKAASKAKYNSVMKEANHKISG